jgi:hypothetical protein
MFCERLCEHTPPASGQGGCDGRERHRCGYSDPSQMSVIGVSDARTGSMFLMQLRRGVREERGHDLFKLVTTKLPNKKRPRSDQCYFLHGRSLVRAGRRASWRRYPRVFCHRGRGPAWVCTWRQSKLPVAVRGWRRRDRHGHRLVRLHATPCFGRLVGLLLAKRVWPELAHGSWFRGRVAL